VLVGVCDIITPFKFGDRLRGLGSAEGQILPRPTLVAMATNFEPKLAITRLV